MLMVKQMAYENANRYCKEVLHHPWKKSLNDYIWICRDIDVNFIQGKSCCCTRAPKEGGDNGTTKGPRTCFGCGQIGHFCKECPQNSTNNFCCPGPVPLLQVRTPLGQ